MDNHYGESLVSIHVELNIASIVQKFTPSIFLSLASREHSITLNKKKKKKKNWNTKKVSHHKAIYHWLFDIKLTLSKSKF